MSDDGDYQIRAMAQRNLTPGLTFDAAAASCGRDRPRYRSEFFDDLAEVVGLDIGSRILEVGCGPGVATEEMIARGWSVLDVEPSEQLVRAARGKFDASRLSVETATLDEWSANDRRFNAVFSGSASHWAAPQIRCVMVAAVLDPGCVIALSGSRERGRQGLRIVHGGDARTARARRCDR